MLFPILITSCLCLEARFKLVKQIKAIHTGEKVGLYQHPVIYPLFEQWSQPIKYHPKTSKTLLRIQQELLDTTQSKELLDTTVPDHTDQQTVLQFARFTSNAYYEPTDKGWIPVPGWNVSARFGWENTGIRGYVFEDDSLENLIIVIKGTSLATPVGGGPTARLDKLNDNMMFSCCCAKAGWEWKAICDCPMANNQCSKSCLLRESNFDGSYYNLAQTIFLTVKEWYPRHTNIWMAGHSLGGALASLVALTNNVPALAFESPGDLQYASRLGLLPKGEPEDLDKFLSQLPIYHFGNTGDPIFFGQCTGVTSSCYWLDYALESKCHVGKECIYDKVKRQDSKKEQSMFTSIQYHSIEYVIKNFIETDPVPACSYVPNCLSTECPTWTFVD